MDPEQVKMRPNTSLRGESSFLSLETPNIKHIISDDSAPELGLEQVLDHAQTDSPWLGASECDSNNWAICFELLNQHRLDGTRISWVSRRFQRQGNTAMRVFASTDADSERHCKSPGQVLSF
jgi:hypothetical protein